MDEPSSNNHLPDSNPEEENSNGSQAFVTLEQFLEEMGWAHQQLPGKYIYRVPYHGKNGLMLCYAQIRVAAEQFIFHAIAPIKVQPEMQPSVAEYLTRANYGLYIGNFEMDYSDGEVGYKSSLDFEGVPLTSELIRNTMTPAVQMMDKYLPGLFRVLYGGISPLDAVNEVEGR